VVVLGDSYGGSLRRFRVANPLRLITS
jgi:hypothetical protein